AIDVENFVVRSREHPEDAPLMLLRDVSLKVAPGALLTGKLGGRITVDGAEVNVVKYERVEDPTEAVEEARREMQEKKEQVARWQDTLREAFPMELTRMEVKNSRLRFIDRSHQPEVDVVLERLHIVATDLQNRPREDENVLPARIQIDGAFAGGGEFESTIRLNPVAEQPRFTANFALRDLQLPPLNSFLRAYANADVSRGTFEMFMEVEAQGGAYDGYVKPLFKDLDFRNADDEDKNLGERVVETVVSTVASALKNDEQEQVATRAPFAGNFADNDVDLWSTIATLFRNAFVQALRAGFEGQTPRK
ncbi:MAG TPA: DUF748 domain-containing protein, partial [Opitutus sp.]|nr:DUF748 domain-containing protein [Opitutus sp.]